MSAISDAETELATNPRQWEAYEVNAHCVVVAPPGSGKTKLLTTRVARDLGLASGPYGAAVITLTNSAATELDQRLGRLDVTARSNLFVGTLHSFALSRIVTPFASLVGLLDMKSSTIATPRQISQIFNQAIEAEFEPGEDKWNVRSTIERLRKRMAGESEWDAAGPRIRRVSRTCSSLFREQNLSTFDDVIETAVELVEQYDFVRRVLTAKFPRIYVDEYQDLAPGLHRIVRALCLDHAEDLSSTLFAVGDPNQAIFSFTGSRPELLQELAKEQNVHPVHLNVNYRNSQAIIDAAKKLLPYEDEYQGVSKGGTVNARYIPGGFVDQAHAAAQAVLHHNQAGTPLEQIAILSPTNDDCMVVCGALSAIGIPSFARVGFYESTPLSHWLEAVAQWCTSDLGAVEVTLDEILRGWRHFGGESGDRSADVAFIRGVLGALGSTNQTVSVLLEVLNELGLDRVLIRRERLEDLQNLRSLIVNERFMGLSLGELAGRGRQQGRVEVTTMTSSKGLEFDVVIILGMDQKKIPHFTSIGDGVKMAEERRKVYVSVTRSRYVVLLLYSGFVEWKSGSVARAGPSCFLTELGVLL